MNIELENQGTVNRNMVTISNGKEKLYIWFSYKTAVAFEYQMEMFCIKNYWSTTTGKLLNAVEPDKKKRLPREVFETKFNEVLKKFIKQTN